MSANSLSVNSLSVNPLSANPLSVNRLSVNRLLVNCPRAVDLWCGNIFYFEVSIMVCSESTVGGLYICIPKYNSGIFCRALK
jgi:hypothetical protein